VYFIQSEIERLLTINLALKKEDLLWDGDGITPNIKGVYTSAPLFVTTPFDDSVEAANVFDLVATIAADINASGGGKYKADTVVLNPIDTLKMKLIKDSSGRYLLPPFVSPNGDITTLKVIESSQVTPNTLVVGDFRYGTIYDLENVTIEMGWINDQFIKNAFTILAEERFALLIRVVDTTAFRKVTDIAAALGALETPAVI
jgi:HK97 family phage major capsid protein